MEDKANMGLDDVIKRLKEATKLRKPELKFSYIKIY